MKNSIKKEQSQTGLNSAERENFRTSCKKYIEIPMEVMERLVEGKCVEGSLRRDKWTGKVTFRAYQRQSRNRYERVVCQLENGWLKESPQRYKFYNSVRKDLGRRMVDVVMHRELNTAMEHLEIEEILDNI
jgi:hypothetical protein